MIDVLRVYLDRVYSGVAEVSSHQFDAFCTSYISIDFSKHYGVFRCYATFYVYDDYVKFSIDGVEFWFSSPSFFDDLCGHINIVRSDSINMKCGVS